MLLAFWSLGRFRTVARVLGVLAAAWKPWLTRSKHESIPHVSCGWGLSELLANIAGVPSSLAQHRHSTQSELQSNESNVLTYEPQLLANQPKLQPDQSQLQPDKPQL